MPTEHSLDVLAPAERVWTVLTDVREWPAWSDSVESVHLAEPTLRLGSRVVIKQPRLPATTWQVTELEPEHRFTWVASSGGVTTTATHLVTPTRTGCHVVLSVQQGGILAPLVRLVAGRLTARYLEMEARGLKQRSERPA